MEAIETRLAECPGVRAAACRVQGDGPGQQIVAFVVPRDAAAPPHFEAVRAALRATLPEYMVPSHFGLLPSLPTTTGGKLDRRALPALDAHSPETPGRVVAPRNAVEEKLVAAIGRVLDLTAGVSVEHDFFHDLGGDSLRAALLISLLREDPATAALAVRDLHEARTVAGLATRVRPAAERSAVVEHRPARRRGRPVLATAVQTAWLLLGLVAGGPAAYLLAFESVPDLSHGLGLAGFVLVAPLALLAAAGVYVAAAVGFAVAVKRTLIGRYRPTREPVWGGFYVRNWIVQQAVRLIPWRAFDGTVFAHVIFRLLGARIGDRVHIHRGVNLLQGGWDLRDIGDDATVGQEASLRLVELDDGQVVVVGPVTLGRGSRVDTRAGVAVGRRSRPTPTSPRSHSSRRGRPSRPASAGTACRRDPRAKPPRRRPSTRPAPCRRSGTVWRCCSAGWR